MQQDGKRFLRDLLGGLVLLAALAAPAAPQTFSSGSTGADGTFNPTCSPTPCTVTVALPPSGVFNFTTITIPANVTVVFSRNAANTPAILLATGGVTINGTIDVSGMAGELLGRPGAGGPGGFEGGRGADGLTTLLGSAGLGPGGGNPGNGLYAGGGGGGYAAAGNGGTACNGCGYGSYGTPGTGGPAYGSTVLQPLVGGSGGGGGGGSYTWGTGRSGGGGGGAILLVSSVSITFGNTGTIRANGGNGTLGSGGGGGGAGGAIRLVAPTITAGYVTLTARGGNVGAQTDGGWGSAGRIRVEANSISGNVSSNPPATTSLPQPVFPPTGHPTLRIARVAGIDAPASPVGSILAAPDILFPLGTTNPVEVVLAAGNIPLGTTIEVTATPQSGARTSAISTGLAGTLASSTATASLNLSLTQTSVLTATATFPLVASAGEGQLYADGPVPSMVEGPVPSMVEGEEVTHVKVVALLGGESLVTYLTRSGREVVLP